MTKSDEKTHPYFEWSVVNSTFNIPISPISVHSTSLLDQFVSSLSFVRAYVLSIFEFDTD